MTTVGGILIQMVMLWIGVLGIIATNPVFAAIGFVAVVVGLVLVFQWLGWGWGFGVLTLLGILTGPALLLTPIILVITLMARFKKSQDSADSETTHAPRPILLEPRDANRSR